MFVLLPVSIHYRGMQEFPADLVELIYFFSASFKLSCVQMRYYFLLLDALEKEIHYGFGDWPDEVQITEGNFITGSKGKVYTDLVKHPLEMTQS